MMSSTADGVARTAGATRHRLSEDVAEAIKNGLIADGLRTGDREAGRILVERGLVDIRPGRGMVVAEFDGTSLARQYRLLLELKRGSFRQLMEMRLALEVGMTEHAAARHTDADDRRIRASLAA